MIVQKTSLAAVILTGIVLGCGTAQPITAFESSAERIVPEFDGRQWIAIYVSTPASNIVTTSYILKNDIGKELSEVVNSKSYPVKPTSQVVSFFHDYYRDTVLKGVAEKNWADVFKTDSQIICTWTQPQGRTKSGSQYIMALFRKGCENAHVLTYGANEKKVFDRQFPAWLELLKKATVICPPKIQKGTRLGFLEDTSRMIQVIYYFESPQSKASSFEVSPRTLWRSGNKVARIDEVPDSINQIHLTTITNEPDLWMINWFGKKGQHMVDPGPTYNVSIPIFSSPQESIDGLEIGSEQAFFKHYGARNLGKELVDSIECDVYELPLMQSVFLLYVRIQSNLPVKISQKEFDGTAYSVRYDTYSVDLPLDSQLFQPPKGIAIEER